MTLEHRNQDYGYQKWGDNDKYLLLLFKTFLLVQNYWWSSHTVFTISFCSFSLSLSFPSWWDVHLWNIGSKRQDDLSQLFSKVDNHHRMWKFWSCLIDIHLRMFYNYYSKMFLDDSTFEKSIPVWKQKMKYYSVWVENQN